MLNPNIELTQEQKTLIAWMQTGRTFQVYADYGKVGHCIIPASRLPVRVFQKTVKKLYQEGLINFKPINCFGQRWDKFFLTKRGQEVVCKTA